MTAIAWEFTPEGFVIGADGRRKIDGVIVTENAQKIYSVKWQGLRIVYGLSGTVGGVRPDGIAFTLKDLIDCCITSMESVPTFLDFVQELRKSLYAFLLLYVGKAVHGFETEEIARILLLSYFNDDPYRGELTIKHDGVIVLNPELYCPPIDTESGQFRVFSGSELAFKKLESKLGVKPQSLNEASALVREYIEECMKHQGIDSDCANIGGHIHIGELRSTGFRWVSQPITERQRYSD